MKIQIDTENKTVTVLDNMNLSKLVKALKLLLRDEYNNYTLEVNSYYVTYGDPWYIYSGDTGKKLADWPTITSNSGSYTIDIQS